MRTLREALNEGDYEAFFCGVRYMAQVLFNRDASCRSQKYSALIQQVIAVSLEYFLLIHVLNISFFSASFTIIAMRQTK